MKDKHFKKWENVQTRGKSRFILINGILAWGLPMFVVMTFIVNKPSTGNLSLSLIAINALIWALGGVCFGYITWTLSERAYQKELEKRQSKAID